MNNSQKRILEPLAIVLAGIVEDLNSKEDDEITEMYEACESATTTNCWFWIYRAAQYMRPVLEAEIEKRRITPRAADAASLSSAEISGDNSRRG